MTIALTARACGKLILTGEHSVVYGTPAIVTAVQRYTYVDFEPRADSRLITFLSGFSASPFEYSLNKMKRFKEKLDRHFEEFSRGQRPVNQILSRPDDLLAYTLASVAKRFAPLGGRLHTRSELPLGAGMGSSASVIGATLTLHDYLRGHHTPLNERFEQIRFCERLQHGKGSALDASAIAFGGVQKVTNGQPEALHLDLSHWYYCLDGIPSASTGECVAYVRQHYGSDWGLWAEFSAVIKAFEEALFSQKNMSLAIGENQKLLCRLGVVPEATQHFIREIENTGATAKISGAGSIRGQYGGMLLIYQPDKSAWEKFKEKYPEKLMGELKVSPIGTQMILPIKPNEN